jgi:hemerythrin
MSESLKIQWTDALKTGHKAIDNQHKYLIDIINDLAEAIETNQAASRLRKIIHLLQYYTEWHFCNEERCMEKVQCPVAGHNKEAHKHFLETFARFRTEFQESGGSMDIAQRMYKELTNWLVQHIQGIDTKMGAYDTPVENAA